MALNDTSDFEQFITDRLDFTTGMPLTGNTGDMESSVTDRIDHATFNKQSAVPPVTRVPRHCAIMNNPMIV